MSLRWSQEDLDAYTVRREKGEMFSRRVQVGTQTTQIKNASQDTSEEPGAPERQLQAKIEGYLERHGYYYWHDRSRGVNTPGFPDLVIACHGGRTVWMELKAKGGKLSEDQKRVKARLLYLGHEIHEIRSFRQAVRVIEQLRIES